LVNENQTYNKISENLHGLFKVFFCHGFTDFDLIANQDPFINGLIKMGIFACSKQERGFMTTTTRGTGWDMNLRGICFRIALVVTLLILIAVTCKAQERIDTPAGSNAFDTALAVFGASNPLQHASWGFCAVDIGSGKTYMAVNEHLSLIPASTLKPFTLAPALAKLGEDYR